MCIAQATITKTTAPSNTGKNKNDHGLPITITIIGLAPAGGCGVRVHNIKTIAKATAKAMLTGVTPTKCAIAMPVAADKTCPPMTLRGCAKGESGSANTIKQLAPNDAINQES